MAIKITVSNTVAFQVRGTFNDDQGNAQAFDFQVTARRLLASELKVELANDDRKVPEFVASVITGWRGVLDDQGNAVPFSADNLARLLDLPGVAGLIFRLYLEESGAKAKN